MEIEGIHQGLPLGDTLGDGLLDGGVFRAGIDTASISYKQALA
jgi:hypothetical protein